MPELSGVLLGLGMSLGTGFMTIVALYMNRDKNQADAVASLTSSIAKLVQNLDGLVSERERNTARINLLEDNLQKARVEYQLQIERLKEHHQQQLDELVAKHRAEINTLRTELTQNHANEMDKLRRDHKTQMDTLKENHQNEIGKLKAALDIANSKVIDLEKSLGITLVKPESNEVSGSDSHENAPPKEALT